MSSGSWLLSCLRSLRGTHETAAIMLNIACICMQSLLACLQTQPVLGAQGGRHACMMRALIFCLHSRLLGRRSLLCSRLAQLSGSNSVSVCSRHGRGLRRKLCGSRCLPGCVTCCNVVPCAPLKSTQQASEGCRACQPHLPCAVSVRPHRALQAAYCPAMTHLPLLLGQTVRKAAEAACLAWKRCSFVLHAATADSTAVAAGCGRLCQSSTRPPAWPSRAPPA